jgi:ElaB/YqjD/DUF883 family membrane-anchored ribosome-binding protein
MSEFKGLWTLPELKMHSQDKKKLNAYLEDLANRYMEYELERDNIWNALLPTDKKHLKNNIGNHFKNLRNEANIKKIETILFSIDSSIRQIEKIVEKNTTLEVAKSKERFIEIDNSISNLSEDLPKILNKEFNQLSQKNDEINNELLKKVDQKLNHIKDYKTDLQTSQNYSKEVKERIEEFKKNTKDYMLYFFGAIIGFCLVLIIPFFFTKLTLVFQIGIRISLGFAFLWCANFLYTNYKYNKVALIKYQHINILLQGGITTIKTLIEQDPEYKKEVNKRIIDMLMDSKDLSSIFSKDVDPVEKNLKKTTTVLKELKDIIGGDKMVERLIKETVEEKKPTKQ